MTGSCLHLGPRRSQARSRRLPAPRARRVTPDRRAPRPGPPPRSPPRRGPAPAPGSRRSSVAGRWRTPRPRTPPGTRPDPSRRTGGAPRPPPGRTPVRRSSRPAVPAGQLANRGLVLEDRLEHALAHLGLVRRVGGEKLAAREDRVDHGRDVVVVDPRAEERELGSRVRVPGGKLFEVRDEFGLGESRLESQLAVETDGGRDLLEELV